MTQSAASQQLRDAERRLAVVLAVRSGRTVQLTAAARRLVESGLQAEATLALAERDARWLAGSVVETCRIAVGIHDATPWLDAAVRAIERDQRAAPIEVVRSASRYGLDAVVGCRAHATVAPTVVVPPQLTATHLCDDELVAVVGRDHPLAKQSQVTAADLSAHRYLTYSLSADEGFEAQMFFRPARVAPSELVLIESVRSIIDTVSSTTAVTVLSRWAVGGDRRVVAVPLVPRTPAVQWSLAADPNSSSEAVVQTLGIIVGCF